MCLELVVYAVLKSLRLGKVGEKEKDRWEDMRLERWKGMEGVGL